MTTSSSFERLSPDVMRWIYKQGWQGLRGAQEMAIPVVLERQKDILITAPTAGGKTEAAFLPTVSWLEREGPESGYGILCLSPLKALINDQYKRLVPLCESAGTEITPWHGDVSQGVKQRSWKSPKGILLVTPESLEAMFVRRQHELAVRIANTGYVIIDEFHSFIDRQRGMQLLSLLSRIEHLIGRSIPRIALSATIGDPDMALAALRPSQDREGIHIDASQGAMNLQLGLKSFPLVDPTDTPPVHRMANVLFEKLRGSSHLVFANSRRVVEELTDKLMSLCEKDSLPVEFFAHHGSLSKDSRHFVEERLKEGDKPTTAIATSTLELGIDIGDVTSVAQIGAPANVSSLRQRLGRSGRREGQSSILRVFVSSRASHPKPTPFDLLEIELFQSLAVIALMLERWIEPPDKGRLHYSTLVQQIVSMIAAKGDVTAAVAYDVLCAKGPWRHINTTEFSRILRALGAQNVIAQLPSMELIIGEVGERLASSYTFYTSFDVPEEYRLIAHGRLLGSLPVTTPFLPGQLVLFGGKRWAIQSVDVDSRVITLLPAKGGQAPTFGGESAPVHREVRQRMLALYQSSNVPAYCDDEAKAAVLTARHYFAEKGLAATSTVSDANQLYWFIWENDRIINTLKLAASLAGIKADHMGPCVIVNDAVEFKTVIQRIREIFDAMDRQEFVNRLPPQPLGKFDQYLSDELLKEAFASEVIDIPSTIAFLQQP